MWFRLPKKISIQPCKHNRVESIFVTRGLHNVPPYNFYEGFCVKCEKSVYGTIWSDGHKNRWNTDRKAVFDRIN